MSWKFSLDNQWSNDLCEYYNVQPEVALKLGTRSKGRKPDLPGSKTCEPISGLTFEDIWESKTRDSVETIFQFQRDLGAWSTFRQCVRHKDFEQFHLSLTSIMKPGMHMCEYGCGVAPFSNTLVENLHSDKSSMKISLTDIEGCEHYSFASWRLNKKIKDNDLDVDLHIEPVRPHSLPKYSSGLDLVIAFEVLEHVPSPLGAVKNLFSQMNDNAIFVENFIKHGDEHHSDDSDLDSAAEEREDYYLFLSENFTLLGGAPESEQPNATRIWRKK